MRIKRSAADYFLDITKDVCPMTFVKVRLQIEKMSANETLDVRLRGAEPLKNVPDSVTELGHVVQSVNVEAPNASASDDEPVHLVRILKS
ncbi:MAG: sulfurtransferase TusA family protein [Alphaproteobacteria bacterium]